MRKSIKIMIGLVLLFSVSYIMAFEKHTIRTNEIQYLAKQLENKEIIYKEIDIELTGIKYNEALDKKQLQEKNERLLDQLTFSQSHELSNKKWLQRDYKEEGEAKQLKNSGLLSNCPYEFELKNQKDVHTNSYYRVAFRGKDSKRLDFFRKVVKEQFSKWQVASKESICFKGVIKHKISKEEARKIKKALFHSLQAKETGYYEDDRQASTYAFYGYTNEIEAYIQTMKGDKSNIQLSFNYNEQTGQTEIMIAFPFTNTPF